MYPRYLSPSNVLTGGFVGEWNGDTEYDSVWENRNSGEGMRLVAVLVGEAWVMALDVSRQKVYQELVRNHREGTEIPIGSNGDRVKKFVFYSCRNDCLDPESRSPILHKLDNLGGVCGRDSDHPWLQE